MVHLILSWLVWAEIECAVNFDLPKWPINQFKPVQQSRQLVLRAYCRNVYIMRLTLRATLPGRLLASSNSWLVNATILGIKKSTFCQQAKK